MSAQVWRSHFVLSSRVLPLSGETDRVWDILKWLRYSTGDMDFTPSPDSLPVEILKWKSSVYNKQVRATACVSVVPLVILDGHSRHGAVSLKIARLSSSEGAANHSRFEHLKYTQRKMLRRFFHTTTVVSPQMLFKHLLRSFSACFEPVFRGMLH
jgi:hypothetical protein